MTDLSWIYLGVSAKQRMITSRFFQQRNGDNMRGRLERAIMAMP
jgi:hypothetical protein